MLPVHRFEHLLMPLSGVRDLRSDSRVDLVPRRLAVVMRQHRVRDFGEVFGVQREVPLLHERDERGRRALNLLWRRLHVRSIAECCFRLLATSSSEKRGVSQYAKTSGE